MTDGEWQNWDGQAISYERRLDDIIAEVAQPNGWRAISALGTRDDEVSLAALVSEAASPDWVRRRFAVSAIGTHGRGVQAAGTVRRLLGDPSPDVARAAIETAERLGDLDSHDAIVKLTTDSDPHTRTTALHALLRLWSPDDLEHVVNIAVNDPGKQVRRKAESVLRHHADGSNWRRLAARWVAFPRPRERAWACELIGEHGGSADLDPVVALRSDPVRIVRVAAEQAVASVAMRTG